MKKTVLTFGLIAGFIVTAMMGISLVWYSNHPESEHSMLLGYASMIIAFIFVFVGIKTYRDKYNHGMITFGQAFKVGLYITLIASTMYVIAWLIEYYNFFPDFMDKYAASELKQAAAAGSSPAELAKLSEKMAEYKEMYKNPIMVVLFTYLEIFPVGLVITLISSRILRRKPTDKVAVAV